MALAEEDEAGEPGGAGEGGEGGAYWVIPGLKSSTTLIRIAEIATTGKKLIADRSPRHLFPAHSSKVFQDCLHNQHQISKLQSSFLNSFNCVSKFND